MKNPIFQAKPKSYRVFRGGHWSGNPSYLLSARRYYLAPSFRYSGLGFRIFRTKEKS